MSWEDYFKKFEGKPPRPILFEVLELIEPSKDMVAIDLGCGAGLESLYLLKNHWSVIAVEKEASAINSLKKNLTDDIKTKLTLIEAGFEDIKELPTALLIIAFMSLPFCKGANFYDFWNVVKKSLLTKGFFAGHFFGLDDDWVKFNGLTGVSAEKLRELFIGFEIVKWTETNEKGPTALGPVKNWHIFTIIAKKV